MDKKLTVLAISYLYPNRIYPEYGIFVHNRLKAVSKTHRLFVINPIPWFPFSFLFKRYQNFEQIPLMEKIDGVKVWHPRFFIIPGIFKWLDALTFLLAVLPLALKLRRRIDLIDLHWTYPDLLSGVFFSKLFKRKFMVTVRGKEALNRFQTQGYKTIREYSLRDMITRHGLKSADRVIALSRELKDMCCSLGVNPQNAVVITNGIDTKRFYYIPKEKARRHLKLDQKMALILGVGSLNYGKGFDRLIKFLPKIADKDKDVTLCLIGSEGAAGFYKKELDDLCKKYGVSSRTIFVGQVPNSDLVYWYNAADVFCLSSRSEGSPNVLYEALACGCPCVATQVGAVPDIMDPSCQGVITENNGRSIKRGLQKVLSKRYERQKNATLMRMHTWEKCGQKVSAAYQDLINRPPL